MKKGFTLIELLAVIVILAVIALIATPAVLNIIEDARKSSAEASARNIASAAKTLYFKNIMEQKENSSVDLSTNTLMYDGEKAKKGIINYASDGTAYGKMYIMDYCVEIKENGTITSEKMDIDDCSITTTTKTFENGEIVYFNPNKNLKCTKEEAEANTSKNSGCMKWYAFLDDGSSNVKLLLSHNTTSTIAWNENIEATTPGKVNNQLAIDVANWDANVKNTARLITALEVHEIAPSDWWEVNNANKYYYFHTGSAVNYTGSAGSNNYAWLFDDTKDCTTYGCNTANSSNMGYWTSNYAGTRSAWCVINDGRMYAGTISLGTNRGIRPVISVSKSILS